MKNVSAKFVMVLLGAAFLAWAISTTSLAQSADATNALYNEYSPAPHTQNAPRPKIHGRQIYKKKIRSSKLRAQRNRIRRASNQRRRIRVAKRMPHKRVASRKSIRRNIIKKRTFNRRLRLVRQNVRTPVQRFVPVRRLAPAQNRNSRQEIAAEINSMADSLEPMSAAQMRRRRQRQQLQRVAYVGGIGQDNNTIQPSSNLSRIETLAPKTDTNKTKFGGSVNLLVGHDNNLDPSKSGVTGTFYQVDPTLNFSSKHWKGSVGATLKDYADQQTSDTSKENEAKGTIAYSNDLSDVIKSTSALDGVYHDEQWPDYISGPDINGYDHGMPRRYTLAKLTETLDFNFSNGFTAKAGGYAEHAESSDIYTDWASADLGPLRFRPSYNQYSAFGQLAVKAGDSVQFALRPSVTDQKYTEREALQVDGSAGGALLSAPLYETIDSQLAFDINLKIAQSKLTPTIMVGQTSDPVNGAMNNTYYGAGFQGNIMLDSDYKLELKPSIVYRNTRYDNWTFEVPNGDKRVDNELTTTIAGDMMFTKSFGWQASYQNTHDLSNQQETYLTYNEEVIMTGAIFTF